MILSNLDPSLRRAFYVIIFVFIALFAATYHTIKVTIQNFEPVIDKNYYETGLNYEKALEDQRLLSSQGYAIESSIWTLGNTGVGSNSVEVKVLKNGEPTDAELAVLVWERNATTRAKGTLSLEKLGTGRFVSNWNLSSPGEWVVTVSVQIQGKNFERTGIVNTN